MQLNIDKSGPFAVARLTGEWRGTDGRVGLEELHPLVASAGAKLAIDVSNLKMIDSSGLAGLISVVTHARLAEARTVLVGPSAFVAGVFDVTRLSDWFDVCNDMDEAARVLSAP
jgi:anti-sigma B factor antagonist